MTNGDYSEFEQRKDLVRCGGGRKTAVSGVGGSEAMPEKARDPGDIGPTQKRDRSAGVTRGKFYVKSKGL